MAVTLVNLTGDISDLIGDDFNATRTRVWIDTNIDGDVVIDTTGNQIHLGNAQATVNSDGTFTFTDLIATNSTTNPTAFQYQVHIEYLKRLPQQTANGKHSRWSSGWFSLTATSDLADVAAESYVPPTWQSSFIASAEAAVQAIADEAEAERVGAEAARDLAEQYRDEAHDISGIDTSDGVVQALIEDSGSATSAALTASTDDTVADRLVDRTSATWGASLLRAPVSLAGYGVLPSNGAAANVSALAAASADLAGGTMVDVVIPSGEYDLTIASGGAALSFANIANVRVRGLGDVVLHDTTTHTNNGPFTSVFQFDNCGEAEVSGIEYVGQALATPSTLLGYQGAIFVRAINGTDKVGVDAKLTNLRYGVQSGAYDDASKGLCSNFDIRLRTSFCGYPIAILRADGIRYDIDADDIHRAVYLAGCNNVRGTARWKNQYIADVACLITDCLDSGTDAAAQIDPVGAATSSRGSSDIDITSIDKGSTVMTTSTVCAGVLLSRVDPVAFRNIKIKVQSKATDTVSRYVGGVQILSGAKAVWSRYAYNWTSNIVLDNVEISGVMDQSAMTLSGNVASGGVYAITYETDATHAATVRNLRLNNFVHLPSAGNTRSNYIQTPNCQGTALQNVQASGTDLSLYTNSTSGDATLLNSKIKDLAALGSNVTLINSTAATMDTTTAPKVYQSSIHGAGGTNGIVKHVFLTLSGASTSWASAIPQGAVVKSVQSRVNTAITGASGYSIGVSGDTTRYGNFLALTVGTTSNNRSWANTEATAQRTYTAATDLVVTANGSNFTGGVVHLMVTYELSANLTS